MNNPTKIVVGLAMVGVAVISIHLVLKDRRRKLLDKKIAEDPQSVAWFKRDGYVYSIDKTRAYPKTKGEFGGTMLKPSSDGDYLMAKNSKGQDIMLNKGDIIILAKNQKP